MATIDTGDRGDDRNGRGVGLLEAGGAPGHTWFSTRPRPASSLTTLLCPLLYEEKERSKGQRSVVSEEAGRSGTEDRVCPGAPPASRSPTPRPLRSSPRSPVSMVAIVVILLVDRVGRRPVLLAFLGAVGSA